MEDKKIDESGSMDSYEINEIWIKWPVTLPENLKGARQLAVEIDDEPLPKEGMPVTIGSHKIVLRRPGYQPIETIVNLEESNDGKPLELGEEWDGKKWEKKSIGKKEKRDEILASKGKERIGEAHHTNLSGVEIYDRNQINKLTGDLEKEQKEKNLWRISALVMFASTIVFLILWLTKEEDKTEAVVMPVLSEIEYVDTIPGNSENINTEQNIAAQPEEKPMESSVEEPLYGEDNSLEAAINYLDNNSEWVFADMDIYPDLRGLYMALDQYNVNKLSTYWADKLKGSQRFKAIAAEAKKIDTKGVQRVRLQYQTKAFGSDRQSLNPRQYSTDLSNMLKEWNELTRHQIDSSDE